MLTESPWWESQGTGSQSDILAALVFICLFVVCLCAVLAKGCRCQCLCVHVGSPEEDIGISPFTISLIILG